MADKFICAMCHNEFEKGRSEEEALLELKETFGDYSPEECELVCDGCWEKIKPKEEKNEDHGC